MSKYIDCDKCYHGRVCAYRHQYHDMIVDCNHYKPTADVEEVRHGRWLPQVVAGVKAWDCSECKTIGSPHWKRCPICEAKMDGGNG